jgi:hypothetical protein
MVNKVIEGTITLVLVFLILTNAKGFDTAVSAAAGGYSRAVRTLQGR